METAEHYCSDIILPQYKFDTVFRVEHSTFTYERDMIHNRELVYEGPHRGERRSHELMELMWATFDGRVETDAPPPYRESAFDGLTPHRHIFAFASREQLNCWFNSWKLRSLLRDEGYVTRLYQCHVIHGKYQSIISLDHPRKHIRTIGLL